ncbi:hypothetical protein HYFRA_00002228 [Hymenoscyphus fraxineus]|uniref:Uncharacterized protein n=1 Tax=Hymenoscyphus fraxineus TaxID=746836 RepID=A0A9N9PEG4_9HELO|nr:hypothetical protein HYFRA_00002228 [Hymenoscyphus fraxineus]
MPLGRVLIPANDIAQLAALFQAGAATITPGVVGLGTLGLLWILYDQWVSNKDIAPVVDVPNSVAGTIPITKPTTTTSATSTASACPTNGPICANDKCKGEGDDEKKKCTVIQIRLLVEQIVLSEESQPVPECMDNNKVALETKLWKAMIINVCASKTLDSDINAIQTAKDVGFPGYDGWSSAMTWKHGQGDCTFGCEEMFNGFLGNTQCSYDSHTFSGSGKSTQSCGTASFVVNQPVAAPHTPGPPPNPPPSPPPLAPPAPPAQGVGICGNGLFFQRDAAANAAKKFCEKLAKDKSWAKGPQSLKSPDVVIYNSDGSKSAHYQFALGVSPDVSWCPKDLSLEKLADTLTIFRCVANFMTGVDGCALYTTSKTRPFLKTVGHSYEDYIQWQVSIDEA